MRKGSECLLRSANSPQEVQPRPAIANDGQRSRERVSAGQALFPVPVGDDQRPPMPCVMVLLQRVAEAPGSLRSDHPRVVDRQQRVVADVAQHALGEFSDADASSSGGHHIVVLGAPGAEHSDTRDVRDVVRYVTQPPEPRVGFDLTVGRASLRRPMRLSQSHIRLVRVNTTDEPRTRPEAMRMVVCTGGMPSRSSVNRWNS